MLGDYLGTVERALQVDLNGPVPLAFRQLQQGAGFDDAERGPMPLLMFSLRSHLPTLDTTLRGPTDVPFPRWAVPLAFRWLFVHRTMCLWVPTRSLSV